jgi:hypothetical protein
VRLANLGAITAPEDVTLGFTFRRTLSYKLDAGTDWCRQGWYEIPAKIKGRFCFWWLPLSSDLRRTNCALANAGAVTWSALLQAVPPLAVLPQEANQAKPCT